MEREILFRSAHYFIDSGLFSHFSYWGIDHPKEFINSFTDNYTKTKIMCHEQFTGRKDNTKWEQLTEADRENWTICGYLPSEWNGRKIFKGDYDIDGNVVVWCDACNGWEFGAFDIQTKDIFIHCHRCEGNFFFEDHINDFRIIGTIHDNPVLLK